MCIRDSHHGPSNGRPAEEHAQQPGLQRVRSAGSEGEPREAVSYTHLRAHETVLDLVCRLLLEKQTPIQLHIILRYHPSKYEPQRMTLI